MLRRIRKSIRAALAGLGILVLTATSAGAHNAAGYSLPYGGYWVWQGYRSISMYQPQFGGLTGGETAWGYWSNVDWDTVYGFNFGGLGDYTNNGWQDCVEAWMDFKRISTSSPDAWKRGNHRNPTVFRHCNTGGNTWGYSHTGITDPVVRESWWAPFVGWDFTLCRATQTSDGRWHRSECTNELGHKPGNPEQVAGHWVQGGSLNHVSDWEIANCTSDPFDARYQYGCKAYLHWV